MYMSNPIGTAALATCLLFSACAGSTSMNGGGEKVAKIPHIKPDESSTPEQTTATTKPSAESDEVNGETIIPPGVETDIPSKPRPPKEGCQAFFSGGGVADHAAYGGLSQIYTEDFASEWVGAGRYPSNALAFPKAVATTFDGIAFDKGTTVTIYELPDLKGRVLYREKGPAVLNNSVYRYASLEDGGLFSTYIETQWAAPFEVKFPRSVRKWSETNMNAWDTGSLTVECQ